MASQTIGALWRKRSKSGIDYMSGVLHDLSGDINIAIFINDKKDKPNQPDYRIVRSDDKEQRQQQPQRADDPFFSGASIVDEGEALPGENHPENGEEEIRVENIPF